MEKAVDAEDSGPVVSHETGGKYRPGKNKVSGVCEVEWCWPFYDTYMLGFLLLLVCVEMVWLLYCSVSVCVCVHYATVCQSVSP